MCDFEFAMLNAVGSLVLCVPVTEEMLLALLVKDVENLIVVNEAEVVPPVFEELVLLVVSAEDETLYFCEDEPKEVLLLRLVEDEELREAKKETDRAGEEEAADGELLASVEASVSGESQGP